MLLQVRVALFFLFLLHQTNFFCLDSLAIPVSSQTISRRLRNRGIIACVAAKKCDLTQRNAENRLNFAAEFINKDPVYWSKVVFSDEKTFGYYYY